MLLLWFVFTMMGMGLHVVGVLKKLVYCYYGLCFLMGMELHMMGFKKNRSTTTAVCVCHDGYK